jgi:hypothetical protein
LSVRYENWHNEYGFSQGLIAGRVGPLHDFPALNTLIVSLLPSSAQMASTQAAILLSPACCPQHWKVLPLHMIYTTTTLSRGESFEDVDAMALFRACLSGEKIGPNWMDSSSDTYERDRIIGIKADATRISIGCRTRSRSG